MTAFIAIISAPPMFWLQRKGIPAVLAMAMVVLSILGIGILIAALAGQSINQFTQDLPVYQAKIKTRTTAAMAYLARLGIDARSLALTEIFDPGAAMKLAEGKLNGLGNMLTR